MESNISPDTLNIALERLGLSQYEERLIENGFDSWDIVKSITEDDLAELGFKRGDRRKLQRAIHEANDFKPSLGGLANSSLHSTSKQLPTGAQQPLIHSSTNIKRPYHRRPRRDENAPSRPKTAYVLFTEHTREDPTLRGLSFADIAKETGKRWQEISPEVRQNRWEQPAAEKRQAYKVALEQYKQTEAYRIHQAYLREFKRKHSKEGLPGSLDIHQAPPPTLVHNHSHPISAEQMANDQQKNLDSESCIDTRDSDESSNEAEVTLEGGMDEIRSLLNSLGIVPRPISTGTLPRKETTKDAVKAFLSGTGSLLYLWTRDQASMLVESLFNLESDSSQEDAMEVLAMAAVGSHCDVEAGAKYGQENFVQLFASSLSSSLPQVSDLRCMRLLACLAICCMTDDMNSTRDLILFALTIGRQSLTFPASRTGFPGKGEEARHWWNIFQSVTFLESWFAYSTGRESRITEQDLFPSAHNLQPYYPARSQADDPDEALHQQVGEIARFAGSIALDFKGANRPNIVQAQVRFDSLKEWHRTLPPSMKLSRLSLDDSNYLDWHMRRSLLLLHLLFLGLFIEPYRVFLIDLGKSRLGDQSVNLEDLETYAEVAEQCISAARQSARVASLLQIDNLIRSRCWVSVYTSFTACSTLLFGASQNLLLLAREKIGEDLAYAASHLNLLSLCSFTNGAARLLTINLQIIFNDIREIMMSPVFLAMCEAHMLVKDESLVSSTYYDAIEGAREVSRDISCLARRLNNVLNGSLNY